MDTADSWVMGEDEVDEEEVDDADGERLAQREGRRRLAGHAGREKLFLEVKPGSLLFCGESKRFIGASLGAARCYAPSPTTPFLSNMAQCQ